MPSSPCTARPVIWLLANCHKRPKPTINQQPHKKMLMPIQGLQMKQRQRNNVTQPSQNELDLMQPSATVLIECRRELLLKHAPLVLKHSARFSPVRGLHGEAQVCNITASLRDIQSCALKHSVDTSLLSVGISSIILAQKEPTLGDRCMVKLDPKIPNPNARIQKLGNNNAKTQP